MAADVNPEPSEVFTKDNLPDLQDDLYDVRHKWYDIGLRIGLSSTDLDPIKYQNKDDFKDSLRDMLKLRLSRTKPFSKGDVLEALRKPSIGEDDLANKLEEEYFPRSPSESEGAIASDRVFEIDKALLPFINVVKTLVELISKEPKSLDSMKLWVSLSHASPGAKISGADQLCKASTVSEFFSELQKYIAIMDADIYLEIVKQSNCEEAIKHFEKFLKNHQKKHGSKNVLDLAKKWKTLPTTPAPAPDADPEEVIVTSQPRISSDRATLTVETETHPSLAEGIRQKRIVAQAIGIPTYLLSMFGCRPGSFVITWHVPLVLVPHIKQRMMLLIGDDPEVHLQIFAQLKITKLVLTTQDETFMIDNIPLIAKSEKNINEKLLDACKKGRTKNVRTLLDKGANINARQQDRYHWTPLMWASLKNHPDTVDTLLTHSSSTIRVDSSTIRVDAEDSVLKFSIQSRQASVNCYTHTHIGRLDSLHLGLQVWLSRYREEASRTWSEH